MLKLQYFGHLMQRADSLEKTLMPGKTEGRRRRGQQRMRWLNSITNSMDMCMLSHFSHVRLRVTLWTARLLCPWDSPGKNTGMGCHALLQGIFLTQESNQGLLHYKQILYCLRHQGSPRILEWVAMPSSRGSPQPRDRTCISYVSCIGR